MFELACQGANIASVPLCPRLSLKAARGASTWILWRLPRVTPWTAEFQRIAAFEPVAVRFLAFCICLTMHLCSPRPTARPTSRVACGEKRRDHPPLILTPVVEGLSYRAYTFQWPACYQPKPSKETQLCALMCRQLHSTVRGVTHVIVERGRKPEAEWLPRGPSSFLLM